MNGSEEVKIVVEEIGSSWLITGIALASLFLGVINSIFIYNRVRLRITGYFGARDDTTKNIDRLFVFVVNRSEYDVAVREIHYLLRKENFSFRETIRLAKTKIVKRQFRPIFRAILHPRNALLRQKFDPKEAYKAEKGLDVIPSRRSKKIEVNSPGNNLDGKWMDGAEALKLTFDTGEIRVIKRWTPKPIKIFNFK